MKIQLQEIPVRDLFEGYSDDEENGVYGYAGRLNIRPKFQREFVYKDAQRNAVIETVRKNFPLNVMYWVKNGPDRYEVLDGQQRTISLCQYIRGEFSLNYQYFHNLTKEEQDQILDYKLMIYICEGTDREKLEWFKTINIAGEKLTDQELRNAVYAGSWLDDAKRHFSKTGCVAQSISSDYIKGSPIRQDYLETALSWIAEKEEKTIEDYMAEHQKDADANTLWVYFQQVMSWVKILFPVYRKEQKGIAWGSYYNKYHSQNFDSNKLEKMVAALMIDEDVTKKSGIYEYLMDGLEKHLSLRTFPPSMKRAAYERQNGICASCGNEFSIEEMEGDHITPWSQGGKTTPENCQMLCKTCNRTKSSK